LTAIDEDSTTLDLDTTIRAAVGLASANLDTQLADLPTVAEFEARTLAAASYATPTNITAGTITTVTNLTNLPAITAGWLTATGIAANAITAAKLDPDVTTELQSGLATAANLATVAGYLDTEIAAILADTNELQTDWADGGRLDVILDARATQASVDTIDDLLDTELPALTTAVADLPTNAELATALGTADDAVLAAVAALSIPTTEMTQSYRATGAAPTLAEANFELIAHMGESSISGTTKTLKKLDGSTTAKVFTLNDADEPTSVTETT
jgi:hypothetical protein